jgi:hypothetical protein
LNEEEEVKEEEGISGLRRDMNEIFALPGYYATSSGNRLPTLRENVSFPSSGDFLALENGLYTLSRNVGRGLPLDAA